MKYYWIIYLCFSFLLNCSSSIKKPNNNEDSENFKWYGKNSVYSRYDRDIAHNSKLIQINPNNITAFYARGLAYLKSNRFISAIDDFTEVIMRDSTFADAFLNRGSALKELKEYDKAISDLSYLIKIKSDYAPAYTNRAIIFRTIGEYSKAIEDYNKAIAIRPYHALAYYNRGNAYIYMGEEELGIKDYLHSIKLDPRFYAPYYNLACTYSLANNKDEALKYFESALNCGLNDFNQIRNDADLDNIRNTEKFKSLLKKFEN